MVNLIPEPKRPQPPPIFKKILETSKQIVSQWEGQLYFVYLPSFSWYAEGIRDINREFVLRAATELGIPIIDIENEVFSDHDDPASLFPFRNIASHYNADGYRLVAKAIAERVQADGVLQ